MLATKIPALFLLLALCLVHAEEPNPFEFISQAGKGLVKVGINTICLADHVDDADIIAKSQATFDTALAGVKEKGKGELTQEKLAGILQVLIGDTAASLQAIDSTCGAATSYCPTGQQSNLGDLGKALQVLGETLVCLVANPNPEILGQIPGVMGAAMQKVANRGEETDTGVNILLPAIANMGKQFQGYTEACAEVVKSC